MVRKLPWIYLALGIASLGLVIFSFLGLFGVAEDPLSAIYLLILALPWSLLANLLPGDTRWGGLLAAIVGLLINFIILRAVVRRFSTGKAGAVQHQSGGDLV